MRLQISRSRNSESLYVIRSVYENGKRSTVVYEKLGTIQEVRARAGGRDPYEWAKEYIQDLNKREKEDAEEKIQVTLSPSIRLDESEKVKYNTGHLFFQKLFYQMGWNRLSRVIKEGSESEIPMNAILQMLLYTRILYPHSKKASLELYEDFLPAARAEKMQLHQVYRALDMVAENSDKIQEYVYKSTEKYCKRNTKVLYYDCTNFFFEIEEEDDFRRYGHSKENRPLPIVQMGMFIDGDGVPLAVTCYPGNESEQGSLKPLEQKILKDFELSKFIVCTDAGLASSANRLFNCRKDRRFIVTQSLKMLSEPLQEWALEPKGWFLEGEMTGKTYDITKLAEEVYKEKLFYKEQIVEIAGLTQRLVVTYSIKYRDYLRSIRQRQIDRAVKAVNKPAYEKEQKGQNDYRRFVQTSFFTDDGEVSSIKKTNLDSDRIKYEEKFDGFYGICTNLFPADEDHPDGTSVAEILQTNRMRWQIESCFRELKSEFKARPVYLSRENRIRAHFLLCFLSLILLKYLEKKLRDYGFLDFTTDSLLSQLRNLQMLHLKGFGFVPAFNPTPLTTALQDAFGFHIDSQIVSEKTMKKITAVSSVH